MISGAFGVKFEWVMFGLTVPFVLLRLYARVRIQRNASLSDAVLLMTWFLFAVGNAQDYAVFKLGLYDGDVSYTPSLLDKVDDRGNLVTILKICFSSFLPYYAVLWGIKLSLILLYYKLIPESIPKLRLALHVTSGILAASWIVVFCLNLFWCLPIERNWTLNKKYVCFAYSSYVPYFVTTGLHFFTDVLVIMLPFPLLRVLNLTPRKRVGVSLLFALGSLCIASTVVRVIEVGKGANVAQFCLWSSVEQATGIIVVCSPALKFLFSSPKQNEVDLENGSAQRCDSGQGWWTAGWATPPKRHSMTANEIIPKALKRISQSNPPDFESSWLRLGDTKPDATTAVVQQRLAISDTSSSSSSELPQSPEPIIIIQRTT